MKVANTLLLASIGSTAAFIASDVKTTSVPPHMSSLSPEEEMVNPAEPQIVQPIKSKAIPFINAPATLDGSMAGDMGFDPFGFSKTSSDLLNYREAEVKHARLAMLAAAGWPLSELLDKKIAKLFALTPALDEAGRVPSILNGGIGKISPLYWGVCLLFAAAIDVNGSFRLRKEKGYIPGKLGFDPLGFYPKDEAGQKWMQTAEIKNGRIAMIAITAFAFQEFASHVAVVDEVPFLFKPFWQVLAANQPTYYIPPVDVPSVTEIPPVDIPVEMPPVEAVPPSVLESVVPSLDSAAVPLDTPTVETPPPTVFESAPASVETAAVAVDAGTETAESVSPVLESNPFDSLSTP